MTNDYYSKRYCRLSTFISKSVRCKIQGHYQALHKYWGVLFTGNASLFDAGSASIGTTTTGADLSPLIPAQEWAQLITEKIGQEVAKPQDNYPMFLVDSEGMGIRGDAFDFITTSPPAVIAKVIMHNN